MTTRIDGEVRREVEIDGDTFTVILTPQGIRLSRKRFRQGRVLTWKALWEQGQPETTEQSTAARRIQ